MHLSCCRNGLKQLGDSTVAALFSPCRSEAIQCGPTFVITSRLAPQPRLIIDRLSTVVNGYRLFLPSLSLGTVVHRGHIAVSSTSFDIPQHDCIFSSVIWSIIFPLFNNQLTNLYPSKWSQRLLTVSIVNTRALSFRIPKRPIVNDLPNEPTASVSKSSVPLLKAVLLSTFLQLASSLTCPYFYHRQSEYIASGYIAKLDLQASLCTNVMHALSYKAALVTSWRQKPITASIASWMVHYCLSTWAWWCQLSHYFAKFIGPQFLIILFSRLHSDSKHTKPYSISRCHAASFHSKEQVCRQKEVDRHQACSVKDSQPNNHFNT